MFLVGQKPNCESGIWCSARAQSINKSLTTFAKSLCSDINPQQTLEKAQPASTPYPASTNSISRNNKVTLHVILLGVGGTIYNQYTITPLLNLGVPTHKVHQLATKLHCHAIKSLKKITKTRRHLHFNNSNSDNGGSGRGITGRAAG